MGRFDSSKTRVEPVFDRLLEADPSGRFWLGSLMSLGSRSEGRVPNEVDQLMPHHGKRWGASEQRLPAPQGLLEWLVQNITLAQVEASGDKGLAREKREALARSEPEVVAEAIARIRAGDRGQKWFILEGRSAPDALLETATLVLVVEGKRTERSTTSETKWMPRRSQLVRHMDAAKGTFRGKRVFGLLLVEGAQHDPTAVPALWDAADRESLGPLLDASLPHRSDEVREEIRAGMLGVATRQRVCEEYEIRWPPLRPRRD